MNHSKLRTLNRIHAVIQTLAMSSSWQIQVPYCRCYSDTQTDKAALDR